MIKVYETTKYDRFKRLEGNRGVTELRARKIMKSIEKVGYIPNPIIVNDRMEVIDGQGRLEALKRMQLPVHYIVVPDIGVEECIAMNINQSNWTLIDYITSHADTGNVSYIYLLNLIKAYGSKFQTKVILYVVTGKIDNSTAMVKDGRIVCTAEDYDRAQHILSWLTNFRDPVGRLKGHNEFYYSALTFCYLDPEVDNSRLVDKMAQLQANLIPVTSMMQALEQIEEIYNNRARKKVYIKTNYRKAMDDRYGWYNSRYGSRYEEAPESGNSTEA